MKSKNLRLIFIISFAAICLCMIFSIITPIVGIIALLIWALNICACFLQKSYDEQEDNDQQD